MSKTIQVEDLPKILNAVKEKRSFGKCCHPIKYVDFSYDNRTGDVFCVTFRFWGGEEVSLHVMNEQRGWEPLLDRCLYFISKDTYGDLK